MKHLFPTGELWSTSDLDQSLTLTMTSQCNFLTKANNDFPRQLISLININSFSLEEDPDRNHITSFTQYIELVNTDP